MKLSVGFFDHRFSLKCGSKSFKTVARGNTRAWPQQAFDDISCTPSGWGKMQLPPETKQSPMRSGVKMNPMRRRDDRGRQEREAGMHRRTRRSIPRTIAVTARDERRYLGHD
jgi:hypothetical protein